MQLSQVPNHRWKYWSRRLNGQSQIGHGSFCLGTWELHGNREVWRTDGARLNRGSLSTEQQEQDDNDNSPPCSETLSKSAMNPLERYCSSVTIVKEILFFSEMNGINSVSRQSCRDLYPLQTRKLSQPHRWDTTLAKVPRHYAVKYKTKTWICAPVMFHEQSMSLGKLFG